MDTFIKPFFSILIPVFNRKFELFRALSSLEKQTLKNFEVIVCDDGSDENILEIIDLFKDKFPTKYVRIENSGGPAKPRNEALKLSTSDWVCFLDSDDSWDPERMEHVSSHIADNVDLIYHLMRVNRSDQIYRRDSRRIIGKKFSGSPLFTLATIGNFIPNSSVVVKKRILLNIGGVCEDLTLRGIEDYDTWLKISEVGGRFKFINKCLGTYWLSSNSLSVIGVRRICAEKLLYKRHRDFYSGFKNEAISLHFYMLGLIFLKIGDRKNAIDNFINAKKLITISLKFKRIIQILRLFSFVFMDKFLKK